MDRGAWQAVVHGVTKSQTQLSDSATTYPFFSDPLQTRKRHSHKAFSTGLLLKPLKFKWMKLRSVMLVI